MTVSKHGPVEAEHTPPTREETLMMDDDIHLSEVIEQAIRDRDMPMLTAAMAEKWSIERAFQESRWETFNHRMNREFFGGDQ